MYVAQLGMSQHKPVYDLRPVVQNPYRALISSVLMLKLLMSCAKLAQTAMKVSAKSAPNSTKEMSALYLRSSKGPLGRALPRRGESLRRASLGHR